jgi:2-iminobutanoate/2-iminopropanoate deaminase
MRTPALIAFALAVAACAEAGATDRVFHRDPSLPAGLPFSAAVIVGDTIYLSGQIGLAAEGSGDAANDIASQTRRIFERYKITLTELGSGLEDIVKCTVFLDDMNDYAAMNTAYAAVFPGDKPARSTTGVDGLAFGAAVEIECLAIKKTK